MKKTVLLLLVIPVLLACREKKENLKEGTTILGGQIIGTSESLSVNDLDFELPEQHKPKGELKYITRDVSNSNKPKSNSDTSYTFHFYIGETKSEKPTYQYQEVKFDKNGNFLRNDFVVHGRITDSTNFDTQK